LEIVGVSAVAALVVVEGEPIAAELVD